MLRVIGTSSLSLPLSSSSSTMMICLVMVIMTILTYDRSDDGFSQSTWGWSVSSAHEQSFSSFFGSCFHPALQAQVTLTIKDDDFKDFIIAVQTWSAHYFNLVTKASLLFFVTQKDKDKDKDNSPWVGHFHLFRTEEFPDFHKDCCVDTRTSRQRSLRCICRTTFCICSGLSFLKSNMSIFLLSVFASKSICTFLVFSFCKHCSLALSTLALAVVWTDQAIVVLARGCVV